MTTQNAMVHRQNAIATGGMSARMARPRMMFPAQNRVASASSR